MFTQRPMGKLHFRQPLQSRKLWRVSEHLQREQYLHTFHFFSCNKKRQILVFYPLLSGVATCETFRGNCAGPALSDDCPSCISGQKDCPTSGDLECYEDYCCHGNIIKRYRDIDVEQCNANCLEYSACAWWSFYNDLKLCYLMDAKGDHWTWNWRLYKRTARMSTQNRTCLWPSSMLRRERNCEL